MFTATMFLYVLGLGFNRIFPRGLDCCNLLRSVYWEADNCICTHLLHPCPTQFYTEILEQTVLQGLECSGTTGPTLGAQVPAVGTGVSHPAVTKSKRHHVPAAWYA